MRERERYGGAEKRKGVKWGKGVRKGVGGGNYQNFLHFVASVAAI